MMVLMKVVDKQLAPPILILCYALCLVQISLNIQIKLSTCSLEFTSAPDSIPVRLK